MARNREQIRQWTLLQQIATTKGNTIPKLASDLSVTTRTIRRDLEALQQAGFPIYDDTINGTKFWRVDPKVLGTLARSGLTLGELAALYFSRVLIEGFAGTALRSDVQSAFDKIERALTPAMKAFLDRLPGVITARREHAKRQRANTYDIVATLLDAILGRHVTAMRYQSVGSRREKPYELHPYRVIHAHGGLYLMAFVPAYGEVRTFAVERILAVTRSERTFRSVVELESNPFEHSLGVHRGGTPCRVRLRFHPQMAPFVKERTWHASQRFKDRPGDALEMTLDVTEDYALRNWVLGFGRFVRVVAPPSLVEWIEDELEAAREQYGPGGVPVDPDVQPALPFLIAGLPAR